VDFRKAHDGLVAVVRSVLDCDPLDGSLFVFLNRRKDRIKLLQWDGNGLWLHYKRLERGTFRLPVPTDGVLTRAQLSMLLEGIDLEKGKIRKHFIDPLRIGTRVDEASRTTAAR
jgi:transposase